jgi:hypothetical protein
MAFVNTIAVLMFVSMAAFGQVTIKVPAPTSEEEYNYLTKDYKVQIESGLDMKRGYVFHDMGVMKQGNHTFTIKGLMRESKNELAAMFFITKSNLTGKVYYTCLPIGNPELFARYSNEVSAWDESQTTSYCHVVSAYMSSMALIALELEKQQKNKLSTDGRSHQ